MSLIKPVTMKKSGDLKSGHSKSRLFEVWISNGPVFDGLGTIVLLWTRPFENRIIQNLDIFVWISNGF